MPDRITIMNASALQRTLSRMAHEIAERNDVSTDTIVVGVQRGGIHLAKRLSTLLEQVCGHAVPHGVLDVNFYRDDLDTNHTPNVQPTQIPVDITGKVVVLVDDVLFSGRTTRAAMDALKDLGRPRRIQLAVLVDRGHRELPIKADFVGKSIPTARNENVDVKLKEDQGDDTVYLERV
ncbi:MAG TPA: bifunctional pyr operon transcriptional regulator/uracil phosphoribosyltransferase PyrR [Verrucomicrobiae bacterium]